MLAAAVLHRRGSSDLRGGPIQVDDSGIPARCSSARDQDLADVEVDVAAVRAVQRVTLAKALPGASPGGVEASHRRVRTRVEGPPVGGDVDPRVERQVERSRGERAQAAVGHAHLRGVRAALRDQHLPISQGSHGRVPAVRRHVRPKAPRVGVRIEDMCLDDAVELRVLVPAGDEQGPVHEVRQAAAEDVVARGHGDRRLRSSSWVPHGGAGVVVNRIGLARVVSHRVVREHLAVLEQGRVDAHDRPVFDRAPLPHLTLVAAHRGRGRLGVGGRSRAGAQLEPPLHGRAVRNGVLLHVALDRGYGLVSERSRSGLSGEDRERQREQQCNAPSRRSPVLAGSQRRIGRTPAHQRGR